MRNPEKFEPIIEKEKEERTEENKPAFKKFLTEQISLPSEEWSEDFKKYVDEKYEKGKREILDRSPEKQRKHDFERYLKGLDLNIEDLKDKKILDLGCGEEGSFVKECLNKKITKEGFKKSQCNYSYK